MSSSSSNPSTSAPGPSPSTAPSIPTTWLGSNSRTTVRLLNDIDNVGNAIKNKIGISYRQKTS